MARAGVAARLLPAVGWEESVVGMVQAAASSALIFCLMCAPQRHFEICALPGAINLPLKQLGGSLDVVSRLRRIYGGRR